MKKILTAIIILILAASCTSTDLFYTARALDITSDMIDIALGPWYVPSGHRPPQPPGHRPPPPPPPGHRPPPPRPW